MSKHRTFLAALAIGVFRASLAVAAVALVVTVLFGPTLAKGPCFAKEQPPATSITPSKIPAKTEAVCLKMLFFILIAPLTQLCTKWSWAVT